MTAQHLSSNLAGWFSPTEPGPVTFLSPFKALTDLGVVVQAYSPSSWECDTGGLSSGPAGLYRDETLSEQAEVADYRLREEHMHSMLKVLGPIPSFQGRKKQRSLHGPRLLHRR